MHFNLNFPSNLDRVKSSSIDSLRLSHISGSNDFELKWISLLLCCCIDQGSEVSDGV